MGNRQIWAVNIALLAVLVWGGFKVNSDWKAFAQDHPISRSQSAKEKASLKIAGSAGASAPSTPEAFTEIASRNPFSFDRNDTNLVEVEAAPPIVTTPKPVLIGTLLLGNSRVALLARAGGTARSSTSVKVGETFEGWQISEIQDKSVVVTANGTRESLVVGRVPIERRDERTGNDPGAVPTPASARPAPAATVSAPNADPVRRGTLKIDPATVPPGSHVEHGPFGDRIVQDQK